MKYKKTSDGGLIKKILKHAEITQSHLAEKLGYSRQHLSQIINTDTRLSKQGRKHLELLAETLEVPGDEPLRDYQEIKDQIDRIEAVDPDELGVDHYTVLTTLQCVLKIDDHIPMSDLPE